jgi:hypothetical protein
MKRLLVCLATLVVFAGTALAKVSNSVLYCSIVPQQITAFKAGSKPSIRVTLAQTAATDTVVTISADGSVVSIPTTLTVPSGSRYGAVQFTAIGAPTDVNTAIYATLGSSQVNTGSFTIQHATILRINITGFDGALPVNTFHETDTLTIKATLDGLAAPAGYSLTVTGVTGALNNAAGIQPGILGSVVGGTSVARFLPSISIGITGSGTITLQGSDGAVYNIPYIMVA